MKKLINFLTFAVFILFSNFAITSCGDNEPDVPVPTPPVETPDDIVEIDENNLIGTWRYSAGNIDYLSFNGNGKGMVAIAADYFKNTGYIPDDLAFGVIPFKYSIDKNIINVFPDDYRVKDFTIVVFKSTGKTLDVLFSADIPVKRREMKLYDNDWEWFIKEGPASIDLTEELVGEYSGTAKATSENGDYVITSNLRFTVTKINNYTVKVHNHYFNHEIIGVLIWSELKNGKLTLMENDDMSSSTHPICIFDINKCTIESNWINNGGGVTFCVATKK